MTKQHIRAVSLSLMLALFLALAPAASATTTLLVGKLFYTTFQNGLTPPLGGPNVFSVDFIYTDTFGLCLGTTAVGACPTAPTAIPPATVLATLAGADAVIFDPTDATKLLVGEQGANLIGRVNTTGGVDSEKLSDAAGHQTSAFGLAATPDKTKLLVFTNFPFGCGAFCANVNVSPLGPLADGATHTVTGPDVNIVGVAFLGGTAYYGTGTDQAVNGFFGALNISADPFTTLRSSIIDDTGGAGGQGALPSHGMSFDPFSTCLILSADDQIWQLCKDAAVPTTFHIVAKVTAGGPCHDPGDPLNASYCGVNNWDQTSLDTLGHMFAANNNGDLLFIDYSGCTGMFIDCHAGGTKYQTQLYLHGTLDDIANGGGAPPPPPPAGGCPATQGFWHKTTNWPNVTVTIDGVIYNGATDHSFVIGGIKYSQAQIAALLPSGSLHTGGYVNALSQFIAAVINRAAGAQTSTIDATISAINADLAGITILGPGGTVALAPTSASLQNTISSFETLLDNYNSAKGLGCSEGVGLTLGGGKK